MGITNFVVVLGDKEGDVLPEYGKRYQVPLIHSASYLIELFESNEVKEFEKNLSKESGLSQSEQEALAGKED